MNFKSSFLTIAAACLLAASMPTFAQAGAGGDTLQKIQETGAITLGYRESSVPFSFLDSQQKPVGISMDLCAAVVDKVK
jgi:glutamate/aspartate transport system substrate-binding protein